ncbi:MAG: hypothetical protein ACTSYU_05165 [Promethearchaeota archaeon]
MDYRLPFALSENQSEFTLEEAIAANFITILKRMDLESEKIIKMSEILWPVMFIQSEPSYKLMIDNVGVSHFSNKITNAPRTAQVGHVLRNNELNFIDRLEKAKLIARFVNDGIDQEENKSSEGEFIEKRIKGLFNPGFLEGIAKMIQHSKPVNLSDFNLLESQYNFEEALNSAQEWVKLLDFIRGTIHRWNSFKDLIREPIEKWKLDLKVDIKDVNLFYKKKIKNAEGIDEIQIKNELDHAKDNVDHWVLKEQKTIIERIGKMFFGIDRIFEEIRQKNKSLLQLDSLRTKKVGDVVVDAYQNIAYIRSALIKSDEELERISSSINDIRQQLEATTLSGEEKIDLLNLELVNKRENQEQEIRNLSKEKEEKLTEIQKILDNLLDLESQIFTIIEDKIKNCKEDEILIKLWQIDDEITHIRNPTSKFHIPIGIALIEDEDMDERLEIVFPSIYGSDLKRSFFSSEFERIEKEISDILDEEMKLRSNFEFTCEKSKNYSSQIVKGMQDLFDKGLINAKMKQKYISLANSLK